MRALDTLRFALDDRINDAPVGPRRVPLGLLGQFQGEVEEFLKGSNRDIDPNQVLVSVEEGSLALVATGLMAATALWTDLERLQNPSALGLIDPKRALVVERWQAAVRKNPNRKYSLADPGNAIAIRVDASTEFRNQIEAVWVKVEKYLQGVITDLGGTTKANVHLKLENGKVLTIASSQQLLAEQEKNRLYKPALLLVTAEENLRTGELRNLAMVNFEPAPAWDEAAFKAQVSKGTKAWAEVPDSWLEELRSGNR
ncbi:MAG: hypothetical protein E6Q40_11885 [Cupriavidus sp.]|nr:MAG: hypothetical protein E6Q40_11885 [Cupriavidus sp.]